MGTLLRTGTKATEHGVAPHLIPKIEEGARATICRQRHVDFLLELQRADLRALHAQGSTVTSATYSILRENLKPVIRQKRRGLLTTVVCLLHENAKPHTAAATLSIIQELRFESIPHLPYSPDVAPTDFHVFDPFNDAMSGTRFRDDDEVRSHPLNRKSQ